ncbi:rab GTPase-activating protein 1-like isoform X2 [Acanthaster planci]|uniref:Rab GTPase-activating protein 1-like isoform X2 n=1 Tax=Acanthaster planci TaxID=133434 RepID=A0A8B7XW08_ACAPL|nr:rab GTPase-activating protein 1-like isoform X2 [Acanthaster planci]
MDDKVSRSSADSLSVTDEFVVVTPNSEKAAEPAPDNVSTASAESMGLKIVGNGNMEDLKQHLDEMLSGDQSDSNGGHRAPSVGGSGQETPTNGGQFRGRSVSEPAQRAGMVYTANNPSHQLGDTGGSPTGRPMSKDDFDRLSPSHVGVVPMDKICTLFSRIIYLGAATVNAPKSEMEATKNMSILKQQQSRNAIEIVLSVPRTSEGSVRLLETDGKSEISAYRITRILFCCRGREGTNISDCFAFTCGHGNRDSQLFQCHIFRCEVPEAVQRILTCFGQAFHRVPRSPGLVDGAPGAPTSPRETLMSFTIPVLVDIREDDGRGNFGAVPRDKRCFKLRQGVKKEVVVTVQQSHHRVLNIERCFGLLISPGREVPDREMHLLDVVNLETSSDGKNYTVYSMWDPNKADLEVLNTESPPGLDKGMFMTIAVDLVITGIQEPVRFVVETKVRIFPSTEKFWYFNKKPVHEFFYLMLEETEAAVENEPAYSVLSLESESQRERRRIPARSPSSNLVQTPDSMTSVPEEESDDDEPLQSGSGNVDKDCEESILLTWGDLLAKWRANLSVRPKPLRSMVRKGIPEALRGEVWQLLAGVKDCEGLMEEYRVLITKNSPAEQVILADITRTFTAHEKFQNESEGGQDAMYKISKAYSVYDSEVGYCQGLSFLAAVLWLHMPEEQAFAVLTKIMYDYRLRDLFMNSFAELHIKFYQLERLIEDNIPDLFAHFVHIGIEAHMYASQWFLTLYTARFPLYTVFHIMDLFLMEGMPIVFNIAVALLKAAKKELLGQDFEGVLKYFRVTLPKRYRTEDSAQELMQSALGTKISNRKLKKYEKEFYAMREDEDREDPLERIERENKQLMHANIRLEQENDELARELIVHRLAMEKQLDKERDRADELDRDLKAIKLQLLDTEEENKHLESETTQIKEMYRTGMEKSELDAKRNATIIADYKQICSQLSERLEKQQTGAREDMYRLRRKLQTCEHCANLIDEDGKLNQSANLIQATEEEEPEPELAAAEQQIRELELELAQTKLQLVESQCQVQDLEHKLSSSLSELHAARNNSWLQKTFSSLKDATTAAKKE